MAIDSLVPLAFFPLRVLVGMIFIVHGWPKLKNLGETAKFVQSMKFPAPHLFALALALTETLGGLALVFGLGVQIFAPLLMIVMLTSTYQKAFVWNKKFKDGYEFDLLILTALFLFLVLGGGRYSLDFTLGISIF